MIFKSKYPDIKIPQVGIYQYVTSNPNKIPDDKIIYVDGITGKSYTFGEFKHESKKFATGLQDNLGFKRGDVLAIFSSNQVDYPIILFGAIAAGGKVTMTNPKFKTIEELSYLLTDSGASVLVVHPEFFEAVIEASINAKIPTSRVLLFDDQEINGYKPYRSIMICDHEIEPINYTPEEAKSTTAYIIYSSGTTGKPKGVERTHTNIAAILTQLTVVDGKLGPHSTTMGVTQFCHAYALIYILHEPLIHGATTIIHSNFNMETFCESIQKYKITRIYATVQTIFELVNDPLTQNFDLSSVNRIISTASQLNDKLERKFYEMFKIPILQAYGLTEMCTVLRNPDTMKNAVPDSSWILLPNMKAKILSEDGRELGYNELGELCVHGPTTMKGYLNNKKATDAVFDKDRFCKTGDIVIPSELESILLTHDAVIDAIVLGYYSEEEATEIPIAYVVIKNGYEQSQSLVREIQFFVDEKVEPHKKLRGGILLIDKIPKSETGKILRIHLKEKLKNDKRIKMN
ncbi:13249_t:CDS:10 [Cetraspora pellucida]|uniref:13249_t:CDS:1 n=1 Tax=Cetraspora pellucida TaxID=1433469 RepID=A0A9N9CF78_9GLOM|nr:13249_t:CDS:10 [Cetraspora pellucida]